MRLTKSPPWREFRIDGSSKRPRNNSFAGAALAEPVQRRVEIIPCAVLDVRRRCRCPHRDAPFHRARTFRKPIRPPGQVVGAGIERVRIIQRDLIGIGVGQRWHRSRLFSAYVQAADNRLRRNAGQPVTGIVVGVLNKPDPVEIVLRVADEQPQTIAKASRFVDQPIGNKSLDPMLIRTTRINRITHVVRVDPLDDRVVDVEDESVDIDKQSAPKEAAPATQLVVDASLGLQREGLPLHYFSGACGTVGVENPRLGAGIDGYIREDLLQNGNPRRQLIRRSGSYCQGRRHINSGYVDCIGT